MSTATFNNTGTFAAQVSTVPADASATTTVGGTAGSVTISPPGESCTVTFSGTAGQQIFTQASFSPAPTTAGVAVFGPEGSLSRTDLRHRLRDRRRHDHAAGDRNLRGEADPAHHVQGDIDADIGYTGSASVTVTSALAVTGSTTVDGTAASLSLTAAGQHGIVTFSGTAGEMDSPPDHVARRRNHRHRAAVPGTRRDRGRLEFDDRVVRLSTPLPSRRRRPTRSWSIRSTRPGASRTHRGR